MHIITNLFFFSYGSRPSPIDEIFPFFPFYISKGDTHKNCCRSVVYVKVDLTNTYDLVHKTPIVLDLITVS